MAITSSTIVDALDLNLNEMAQDGLKSWDSEYDVIFNIKNSTKQSEKDSYESGFGQMPKKPEGVAATYDTIINGISTTYVHSTYALGYEITEEAIDDNQREAETFSKLPDALVRSGTETVEVTAFNIFNNAFSTNGFDGVPLCSTSHPTLDGSTQSNRPSTDADLSVTSLTAGLTAFEDFTDERGLKRPLKAATLLVPTALWNIADELLDSDYKPYTANNEKNAVLKKMVQPFVSHYLTDSDAWFLVSKKEDHKLKFFWRRRMGRLRRGSDFDTTNLKHLLTMRFSVNYSHWMGVYGTQGA